VIEYSLLVTLVVVPVMFPVVPVMLVIMFATLCIYTLLIYAISGKLYHTTN